MTDPTVRAAIDGWQQWEDAINQTGPQQAPAWSQVNGRRWAEPGE